MELDEDVGEGSVARQNGGSRAGSPEADPRGYYELAFVGEGREDAKRELDEGSLGPEFDSYEDLAGDKLRLLDSFSIYYEDGRPAPPCALDSAKERGERFVAYGTLVAPLTADARGKLVSLDFRLKGRIPPCLPKRSDGAAPEPLPWVSVSSPTPTGKIGGTAGARGGAATAASPVKVGRGVAKKAKPRGQAGSTAAGKRPDVAADDAVASGGGAWGGGGDGGDDRWSHRGGSPDGGGEMWDSGGGNGGGEGGGSAGSKRPRKSNSKWSSDNTPEKMMQMHSAGGGGGDGYMYPPDHMTDGGGYAGAGSYLRNSGYAGGGSGGYPMERFGDDGSGLPPPPPLQIPMSGGEGAAGAPGAVSIDSPVQPGGTASSGKKRKAESGAATAANKRQKPPPNFSLAAFVGGLDGSETRGVVGSEFVGSSFRRGRKDGLLLYYVDRAPRDYPFEYESKAAGAASLDWSYMSKHLKVDAFCMETFRWYGAKVAEVSVERQQVKVHFNGWKSKFDEWMDWESFRLAPCGSRSSAKREGEEAGPVKKESSTRCVLVPARRTARIRIATVDDWCIDYSDPLHPVLWVISPYAWYKVAGSGWWDFVAPHPLYASIFEPSRRAFAVSCLIARCLQSSPTASFNAVARRVSHISSAVFEAQDIIQHQEVVISTVLGMGTLSTKKRSDGAGDGSGAADGDDMPDGSAWPSANGDGGNDSQLAVTVEAKDTLFLRELRMKVTEWQARSRPGGRQSAALSPPRGIPSSRSPEKSYNTNDDGNNSTNKDNVNSASRSNNYDAINDSGDNGDVDNINTNSRGSNNNTDIVNQGKSSRSNSNNSNSTSTSSTNNNIKKSNSRSKKNSASKGNKKGNSTSSSTSSGSKKPHKNSNTLANDKTSGSSLLGSPANETSSRPPSSPSSLTQGDRKGKGPGAKGKGGGAKGSKEVGGKRGGAAATAAAEAAAAKARAQATAEAAAVAKARALAEQAAAKARAQAIAMERKAAAMKEALEKKEREREAALEKKERERQAALEKKERERREKQEAIERRERERLERQREAMEKKERERQERAREAMEKKERERQEREAALARKEQERLAREAALEKKAQERLERQALLERKAQERLEKQATLERKAQERLEKQRQLAEEKEQLRKVREAERVAKMEAKRMEKEAQARERAEAQAREQARREIEREKARLAKRYPLPDDELWDEERALGKQPAPWPESGPVKCPKGFPVSSFGDALSAWACLQLFGTLMHLQRFSLDELMTALAHGYNTAVNDDQERSGSQTTDQNRGQPQNHHHHHHHHRPLVVGGWNNDQYSDSMANDRYPGSTNNAYTGSNNHYAESDSENLLDVIPAPLPFRGGGGEGQGQGEDGMGTQHKEEARAPTGGGRGSAVGPDMLANVHMRLLDFLAWDRTRSARCGPEGKQDAYWRTLLLPVGSSSSSSSSNAQNGSQQPDAIQAALAGFSSGDDEDFKGRSETTLPGLRDARELLQASPHGWPELLRLVVMHREGVLDSVEDARRRNRVINDALSDGHPEMGRDYTRKLRARHLDPLGEVMRILRHVARYEEARPFLEPASDADVDPDGVQTEKRAGAGAPAKEGGGADGGEGGDDVVVKKEEIVEEGKKEVKRPLDLGTILKRAESGWYDLEATSESPIASNSFAAGHAGVAMDMALLQQGWLEARGADSTMYQEARVVAEEFQSLYETHVLEPLAELGKDGGNAEWVETPGMEIDHPRPSKHPRSHSYQDNGDDTEQYDRESESGYYLMGKRPDPMAMLRQMGSEEYAKWSPEARSRALAWLCDEALSAATINDLVKRILEARENVDRRDREVKTAVRQKIKEQEARDAIRGGASNRRSTEAEMINARMAAENDEMQTIRQLGSVRVRLKPLGSDRDRRRYWMFARGEDHRLFTELAGEWGVYAKVSQLKALHKWLDRRGTRERTLKAAVREHLISNLGVNAEELDPPDRRCQHRMDRMEDDSEEDQQKDEDQQYLGEPAEVAREKERERNAGREALKACGFVAEEQRLVLERLCHGFAVDLHALREAGLAFELRTAGFVMRDIAVHMGCHGLGLQLNVRGGGVVVCGHTTMPPGVGNPGQAAGVRIHDLLVSVHNSVAETPRTLAAGLRAQGLAQSGKLVVVKVLTWINLTDEKGEPAEGALDFKPIDRVKGALLEAETRLHHDFVIGRGWEGQTCREWRLAVAFAGHGLGKGWGHGVTMSSASPTTPLPEASVAVTRETAFATKSEGFTGGIEALSPFRPGHGPVLSRVGTVDLGPVTPGCGRAAVAELGKRMLQLEAAVSKQDTVVDARWGESGRRRKWRTFVTNSQTAAQLLAAWSAFSEMVDWHAAHGCYSDLDRRNFFNLLPAHTRNSMPDVGDSVLYYGDGHVLSVQAEAREGHKGAWGHDPPRPGAVGQYAVRSMTYHQGGSSRRAKGSQPFATIELEPIRELGPPPPPLGLLPAAEPFGTLNRLLKRSIKAMRERAEVQHFLVPVPRSIYPDYYDVINEPMDLGKLLKRCSACRYRSVDGFKNDLALVASNCRRYCEEKFPSLPPAADAVVKVGMEILDEPELAAELSQTVEEGNRLEALWNKHMSKAISASPELATMPGMQKLARQLGFSIGDESVVDGQEESDDDFGQPDTARIARQVFYDKLVPVKYGEAPEINPAPTPTPPPPLPPSPAAATPSNANGSPPPPVSTPSVEDNKPPKPNATTTNNDGDNPPGSASSPAPTPAGGAPSRNADSGNDPFSSAVAPVTTTATLAPSVTLTVPGTSLVTLTPPAVSAAVSSKLEEAVAAPGGHEGAGEGEREAGVLRVSMGLSNEMPEFVVARSKYDEAIKFQWRSEMHIQMAFMDEPGHPPRIFEGTLVGVKANDKSSGLMPWESLLVEWDDESETNTVNPWEVEAVSAATAAARRRAPVAAATGTGGVEMG